MEPEYDINDVCLYPNSGMLDVLMSYWIQEGKCVLVHIVAFFYYYLSDRN